MDSRDCLGPGATQYIDKWGKRTGILQKVKIGTDKMEFKGRHILAILSDLFFVFFQVLAYETNTALNSFKLFGKEADWVRSIKGVEAHIG